MPLKEAIDHVAGPNAQAALMPHPPAGGDRIIHSRLSIINPESIIRANGQVGAFFFFTHHHA